MLDVDFLLEFYPLFLKGVFTTLQIAFWGCLIGVVLGTVSGIVLTRKIKIAQTIVFLYVTIIRGTPMLIQIAGTFYLLKFAGVGISAFWSAILSIGLNSGAYVSQIVVSGVNAVGRGQIEAAKTLGFSDRQIIALIVLPQAVRTVLPALGSEFITLVKDSSLASTIGVYELTKQGEIVMSQTFDAPAVFITVGCVYLCITSIISIGVSKLEAKLECHVKR